VDKVYFHPTNLGVYTYGDAQPGPRFWRRQFGDAPTRVQFRFDVAFGLVIPVLCFVFDPVVFRGGVINSDGFYQSFRLFAYAASALEMATLACWLLLVRKFPAWSRPAGGVLAAGAFFSFALGVAILPLSLIGLVFAGIGALGFIPFVTAIVYMRNARRALRLNRTGAPVSGGAAASFVFGLALALGAPAVAQHLSARVISSASAEALAGGELSPRRRLFVRALVRVSGEGLDDIVKQYSWESDDARRASLATAYWEVTGEDIEEVYRRRRMGD
jgi:hypothetical protein